ncbi:ribosome maturation factor RimP [Myxococcota bacterium]|nr:ribosome maturation factor RimP [Myxococcota bacterium]MBU1537689.1 ribosome maturation factor RimP [Myxococcota bacterium]
MTSNPAYDTISQIIKEVVESSGYELWGTEWTSEHGSRILRVYVEGESGVTIDACASVSRLLGPRLDVEDAIVGAYRLEVSSPGLERPLFTMEQFSQFVGSKVKVRLDKPLEKGIKKLTGVLSISETGELIITNEVGPVSFPFEYVKKANLVYEF